MCAHYMSLIESQMKEAQDRELMGAAESMRPPVLQLQVGEASP